MTHTAIIGGGPAGLMAAEILAKAGHKVTVYDRKPSLGRKFLMAGRGGLNITHSEPLDIFLTRYGTAQPYLSPVIRDFTPDMLRAWCEGLEQETFVGSSGRVFPKAMKASPLLRAWLGRLESLGVEFRRQYTWAGWNKDNALIFHTADRKEELIKPDYTLLALGGASWPDLGSDGSWANILMEKHIPVTPFKPANCGFAVQWSDHLKTRHAGEPLKNIGLTACGKTVAGEMIIGEKGIEGGAVYALSSLIRGDIEQNGRTTVSIDLRPNMTEEILAGKLNKPRGRQSFSTWVQKSAGLNATQLSLIHETTRNASSLSPEQLARGIKCIPLTLTETFPLDRAISTAGGIPFDAMTDSLMIKAMPATFACGEMLDWEAPTGGYLLQACLATGVRAANGILRLSASS